MTKLLTLGLSLAVPLLLGPWACALAQTLGSPAASAWIGQPLEMTVPARFEGGDNECVQAEVFYGDNRLGASQVRTTVIGTDQERRVRIEADSPINEPVVMVSLRAGCRNTITRNYTLLPELPSASVLASLTRAPALAPGGVAAAAPLRLAPGTRPATVQARGPRRADARPAFAQAQPQEPAPRARALRALRDGAPALGPRLRLEPIDAAARPFLRVTANLSDTVGDPARRATAALLWQAINADPQELLRTGVLLQKLESDLAQLRQTAGQTRSEVTAMRRRLDEAQPWYASTTLAQVLGLLVLAAATAAGLLWYRTRRSGAAPAPWYRPVPENSNFAPAAEPLPQVSARQGAQSGAQPTTVPAAASVAAAAVAPVPVQPVQQQPATRAPAAVDFDLPVPGAQVAPQRASTGVLRVETLAATFEEVEFLSSLGLTSDAMDVLKTYLQDSTGPAPIAFLALMRLCDEGEDATALPMVRRRYVQAFGIEAPRLEQVLSPLGLETRTDLTGRITRAWGTSAVLDIIEEALFQVQPPATSLTLQAGRDLLCLYDLGIAVLVEAGSPQDRGTDADAHPLAPWTHAEDVQSATQALAEAQGGYRFALDVDLTAAPETLPETQPTRDAQLAPLLAGLTAAAREAKRQPTQDEVDAFSAAMASERMPIGRP